MKETTQGFAARVCFPALAAVLVSVFSAICLCPLPAQGEWQSFGIGDGLVDNAVMAIVEDRSERLWFGTNNGVSCYDGVSWTSFTTADGLANDGVLAILEDGSGVLWFGTFGGGVSRYDGEDWTTYTEADGLAGNEVSAVVEDREGNLWFATSSGASRYDGTSWTTYTSADGLAGDSVVSIFEDGSGRLWFGTEFDGVSCFDGAVWSTYTVDDGLAANYVLAICEDSSGSMWFCTGGGLSRYDGATWTNYTTTDGLAGEVSRAITEDSDGRLWYASFWSPGGVSCFDGVKWTTYTTTQGLVNDHVVAVLEDSSGNMWFGTWGGLSRYDGVSWVTYTTSDGLSHNEVFAIRSGSSGDLWFGTEGGGVSRYDGLDWTTYAHADGLAGDRVRAVAEDHTGNLWFGTWHCGVSRYDGSGWTTYSTADGLVDSTVTVIIEDRAGSLWFGTPSGVTEFDGVEWNTYTTGDGLAGDSVSAILESSTGSVWFGTGSGVSCYDGTSWMTYTTADGLASNDVRAIAEDRHGHLWFGTSGHGVSCYDGSHWTSHTEADGLPSDAVLTVMVDSAGDVWVGTEDNGVGRYTSAGWTTCTAWTWVDGLASNTVRTIAEDGRGSIWFGFGQSGCGVSSHRPDRTPVQAVISAAPPELSAGRAQTMVFAAAYGESWGARFSHSLDGSSWSEWSPLDFWVADGLSDGGHVFQVVGRDRFGNVDPTPAVAEFGIDGTPPVPMLSYPTSGEAVRDSISVIGTAADPRFERYTIQVRPEGSPSWQLLACSGLQVTNGVLGGWNTVLVNDGDYEVELSVSDTLGLTGVALINVVVDNAAPWAWQTTPVLVSASCGGDVYTTNREAHLYFPPHAFENDATVVVEPTGELAVPDTLPGGAELILAGYDIAWEGVPLEKAATLEVKIGEDSSAARPNGVLSLYLSTDGVDWQRLGGTLISDGGSISAPITSEGTYAVYIDAGVGAGGGLSAVTFSPRVFSLSGSFAREDVGIGFTLGRSGPVTVSIYNRAGRLVRKLATGVDLGAGANLLRWDGREDSGSKVPDGLYIVTVEALGETRTSTLAVVR